MHRKGGGGKRAVEIYREGHSCIQDLEILVSPAICTEPQQNTLEKEGSGSYNNRLRAKERKHITYSNAIYSFSKFNCTCRKKTLLLQLILQKKIIHNSSNPISSQTRSQRRWKAESLNWGSFQFPLIFTSFICSPGDFC